MNILSVGAKFHADRRTANKTDITKQTVAFRYFANASKIGMSGGSGLDLIWFNIPEFASEGQENHDKNFERTVLGSQIEPGTSKLRIDFPTKVMSKVPFLMKHHISKT
jgi:hypothetical protein